MVPLMSCVLRVPVSARGATGGAGAADTAVARDLSEDVICEQCGWVRSSSDPAA